jgi:acyl carrier protein
MSTIETVREIMMSVLHLDELDLTDSTTAADVEEWDSLHHIRLVIAIERRFKIKFKNAEVERLTNVGDLIRAIDQKVAA